MYYSFINFKLIFIKENYTSLLYLNQLYLNQNFPNIIVWEIFNLKIKILKTTNGRRKIKKR